MNAISPDPNPTIRIDSFQTKEKEKPKAKPKTKKASLRPKQTEATSKIFEQEERLNVILENSQLDRETILDMEEKLKEIFKNLKHLSKDLAENVEDTKKGWFSSTGKKVIRIATGAAVGYAIGQGAQGYATFAANSFTVRCLSFVLGAVASLASDAAGLYANVVWLKDEKIDDLVIINKDGIEQVRVLKKLIRQVKKMEGIETDKAKKPRIGKKEDDSEIENGHPDRRIQAFLTNYEKLKTRNDDVYFKIIPLLIEKILALDDPLREDLIKLKASAKILSQASSNQSLAVDYLNSSSGIPKPDAADLNWKSEQHNRQNSPTDMVSLKKAKKEYAYNWILFNEKIEERLKIRRTLLKTG